VYKWLPSKELVIVFIVVAIFVALVAFFTILQPKPDQTPTLDASADAISEILIAAADQDSDNDGLKDWEESLRGTSPNNPDSDGDGTSDGEEVAQSRNPLIAGPDDAVVQSETSSSIDLETKATAGEGVSNTDALAINLFKNYLEKKENGQAISAADQQSLVNAIAASGNVGSKPPRYSEGNLSIGANSTSTLLGYKAALEDAIKKLSLVKENELLTLQRALQESDGSAMDTYKSGVALYDEVVKDLLSAKVPRDATATHLNIVNSLAALTTTLRDLLTINSDPLIAFTAISNFEQRQTSLTQAFRNLGSYLLVKNMTLDVTI